MVDEHDLITRLESGKCGLIPDNYGVSSIVSPLPIGSNNVTNVTPHKIRLSPAAVQCLRIPARLTFSFLTENTIPEVLRKGKEIFSEEMPALRAASLGESTWEDELQYGWEDGASKKYLWNSKPLFGDKGNGVIGVYDDITDSKKALSRLRTHYKFKMVKAPTGQRGRTRQTRRSLSLEEAEMLKVFQNSPDSICISTLEEGRYIQVNNAFLRLSGYKNSELIGHTSKELGIWVIPDKRDHMLNQLKMQGIITNYEMQLRIKSGQVLICLVSGGIIEIDDETHMICIIKDITERKHMEEKLRASEERLSKSFNSSPYPMCISTLQEGRFIEVNESFCRVTGYSSVELLGKSALELGLWVNPEERCQVKNTIANMGSVRELQISFRTKSGGHRVVIYNAERIEVQDTPCLFIVIMDITEKKEIETEMIRLDRLNLVGEMAINIGHEIRNPMTTVRGYLQLLKENEKYIPETEYFDLMIEELDKANLIITEFLSLAKNKLIELTNGNINSIINNMLPILENRSQLRNQHIIMDLVDLPNLLLDKKEVHQLILNLVQNGLESMQAGGIIFISTYYENEDIVLTVRDQGHGIRSHDLDKLGTPFFTTKDNGTGLGLAVCYRIAAHHNAKIEIETGSTGTTFYVKFPLTTRI